MTEKAAESAREGPAPAGLARRLPAQRRSRERYERILDVAAEILREKGGDGLRMSDIVERAAVPFGSLYQYFPDKTAIIGTLAERYNAVGRACVEAELAPIESVADLHPALCRVVDGYYQMFINEPVMGDIWSATQTDKALQALDDADAQALSGILLATLQRLAPERDPGGQAITARLTMQLIAAAVRHAIKLERAAGDRVISTFKRMLPKNLATTDG